MKNKVNVKAEQVKIPTYKIHDYEKNPIFFENRNVQGASGDIFPMAFNDRIEAEFQEVAYNHISLENQYIKVGLLPEIGGRIYSALDKTNNYDFVYKNNVIKPALIGLCGPWIMGGIEFNWPQHHRPTTFLPVDYYIEENEDGSKTVWMGEVEPLNRTKGMVGITVYPDKSYIEAKIRLFNRTAYPQRFMWWSNLAVPVNDTYKAVFPKDIHWASDHAWALTSSFPIIKGEYKTKDFKDGVDVREFQNMPVPTSFFTYDSKYDFLSGYDFVKDSGIVHVSNRHIGTGKKMFTWGVSDFSKAWYDNLTDEDGPYIELMTGVYSCNQPDFSWIMPYEYKTAEEYWYPIRNIGEISNANIHGAVGIEFTDKEAEFALNSTEKLDDVAVVITCGEDTIYNKRIKICPEKPFKGKVELPEGTLQHQVSISMLSSNGKKLLDYRPEKPQKIEVPAALTPAPDPDTIETVEDLYLHALHIWQYRHPYYHAVDYLNEALKREPENIRCNTLMGKICVNNGEFDSAASYFEKAIKHSIMRNPNPYDTEPYYNMGIVQKLRGNYSDAYDNLYRSVWIYAWKTAGYYALAEIDCMNGEFETALNHINEATLASASNFKAEKLKSIILRKLHRYDCALKTIDSVIETDKLDFIARYERYILLKEMGNIPSAQGELNNLKSIIENKHEYYLDIAIDYGNAGLYEDAVNALKWYIDETPEQNIFPINLYYLGYYYAKLGNDELAKLYYSKAADLSTDYCLHSRLESIAVLKHALNFNTADTKAPYYLGNIYYGKHNYSNAIRYFEISIERGADFPTVYRNLAIGYFDKQGKLKEAGELIRKAFELDPTNARVFFELMQYNRNTSMPVKERLNLLEENIDLVKMRDDHYIKLISTYIEDKQYEKAIRLLKEHTFHPYEGGEGVLVREHISAHIFKGLEYLKNGNTKKALELFIDAATIPKHYNEGKRPMRYEHAHLDYYIARAYEALGDSEKAKMHYEKSASDSSGSPEMDYYAGMSLRRLNMNDKAVKRFEQALEVTEELLHSEGRYSYFTKTLITTLPFEHDTKLTNEANCNYYMGLAYKGLGDKEKAKLHLNKALKIKSTMYKCNFMLEELELD